jgi:hypothetical protein
MGGFIELFGSMNKQLLGNKKNIPIDIRRRLYQAIAANIVALGSESWALEEADRSKLEAFHQMSPQMCCVYQFLIPVTFNDATPYYLLFPPQTRPHPCGQVGAVGLDGRFFLCLESAASLVALSSERSANNSGVMAVVQVERVPCPCDRQPVSDEVKSASQASTNNNA